MADRYGYQFTKTLLPDLVILDGYAQVTDAAGALSLDSDLTIWCKSIVRNSTGKYTITLLDDWPRFAFISPVIVGDAVTDAVVAQPLSWVSTTGSGGSIVIQVMNFSGAATDIVHNGGLFLSVHAMNNSSV